MSNKFLLNEESSSATNPLNRDLDANGNSLCNVDQIKLLSFSGNTTAISAGTNVTPSYSIRLPDLPPENNTFLEITDGTNSLWTSSTPAGFVQTTDISVNDTQVPVYDGISGDFIKTTSLIIDGSDNLSGALSITTDTLNATNSAITPVLTLDTLTAQTNIGRPNSGSSYTIELPESAPANDSVLQVTKFGIGSWSLVINFVKNPAQSTINVNQNDIINAPVIKNDLGNLSISTTDQLDIISTSTTLPLQITHTGASGVDLAIGSLSGSVNIASGELNNEDAISLITSSTSGVEIIGGTFNVFSSKNTDAINLTATNSGNIELNTVISGNIILNGSIIQPSGDIKILPTMALFVENGAVIFDNSTHTNAVLPPSDIKSTGNNTYRQPYNVGNVGDLLTIETKVGALNESFWQAPVASQFSGCITGILPNNISNVIKITAIDAQQVFSVTAGDFLHADFTNPQAIIYTQKTFVAQNNILCTLLNNPAIGNVFIYLDATDGITIIQSINAPGTKQHNQIYLGNLDLRDNLGTNDVILRANQLSETAYSILDTLNQIAYSKNRNLAGCIFSDTGVADLTLTHSAGEGIRLGSNTVNNIENPDRIGTLVDEISFVKYHYIDVNGDTIISTQLTLVTDPGQYNNGGTLSVVSPIGRFTIQYIYFFYGSNTIRIVYGDMLYSTMVAAIAAVTSFGEQFKSDSTEEAVLRGVYITIGSNNDNTDPLKARFITLSG